MKDYRLYKDVEQLKEEQEKMKKEIDEIKIICQNILQLLKTERNNE